MKIKCTEVKAYEIEGLGRFVTTGAVGPISEISNSKGQSLYIWTAAENMFAVFDNLLGGELKVMGGRTELIQKVISNASGTSGS